jgi:hypothetical protein
MMSLENNNEGDFVKRLQIWGWMYIHQFTKVHYEIKEKIVVCAEILSYLVGL